MWLALLLSAWAHDDLSGLVATMAASSTVDSEAVGYEGVTTPTWTAFARMRELASPQELRQLLSHRSPVVRVYALQALWAREPGQDAVALLLERLSDRAAVETMEGCISSGSTVADEAFGLLSAELDASGRERVLQVLLSAKPPLASASRALFDWDLPAALLPTIREHARRGTQGALAALGRAQQPEDVPILKAGLEDAPWEALLAVSRYPHPDLLPVLQRMQAEMLAATHWDSAHAMFYQAAAAYGAEGASMLAAPLSAPGELPQRGQHVQAAFEAASESESPALVPLLFRLWEQHHLLDCDTFERLQAADPARTLRAVEGTLRHPNQQRDRRCLSALVDLWTAARGRSGHDVLVAAVRSADVHHFEALAMEAARVRAEGAIEVLLQRFRSEWNAHIYLAAARALLAYEDEAVRARLLGELPSRRETAEGWGLEALDELLPLP